MGQKVHPLVLRLGIIKDAYWRSVWFANARDYPKFIEEDYRIRDFIKKNFKHASISKIEIERVAERVKIKIFSARPGIIIGRHGADIERLREDLNNIVKREISIDIKEVTDPELDAQIVAEAVALQLEKRVAFRRAIKRAISQAITKGAQGIKVSCAGRLGGAEMSRRETFKEGKVPLQTLRARVDYGFAEALTTYGVIGVKTWIYKGDELPGPGAQESSEKAKERSSADSKKEKE